MDMHGQVFFIPNHFRAGTLTPLGVLPPSRALRSVATTSSVASGSRRTPSFSTQSTPSGDASSSSAANQVVPQSQGMILSPALQPIPARLVHRIQSGEFVEMRDLLCDNIALHNQLETI